MIKDAARMPGLRRLAQRLLGERLFDWLQVIVRVRRDYARLHGHPPAILRPRRYTEKMQWSKLFDLDPCFAILSAKLASREFVAERLGPGFCPPLLWSGADPADIPYHALETPYVIKTSHGCGHTLIVTDPDDIDEAEHRRRLHMWLDSCYGTEKSEPGYVHVPPRILIERMLLGRNGSRPLEHRAFVFRGEVRVIQVSLVTDQGAPRNAGFFTPDWRPLGWRLISPLHEEAIRRPAKLDEMIATAERLGAGMQHVRVDFYECDDEIWVGELTLYSWSGVVPFHPPCADHDLGQNWNIRWPALKALWTVATRKHEIRPPGSLNIAGSR